MSVSILSGIKVVELGAYMVVPVATRCMADWGAEVIKVEDLGGDLWRGIGPAYYTPKTDEENPIYQHANINKTHISLNLKSENGKKVLLQLLEDADVFVTSVRLKSLEKLGLTYEDLAERFPRLIYCHSTGYGYEGEMSDRPGFDISAFWGKSGAVLDFMAREGFPVKPTGGFGDTITSGNVLSGILAALIGRSKTGKGMRLTTSLMTSGIWCNATLMIAEQDPYNVDFPKSWYAPTSPFSHCYQSKDGKWFMTNEFELEKKYEKLCRTFDLEELIGDTRYSTVKALREENHMQEIIKKIMESFGKKTADEWIEIFDRNDIAYSVIQRARDISEDPQAWANDYLQKVTFPTSQTTIAMPNPPVKFFGYEYDEFRLPGGIGENTREVMLKLGYSNEQIDAMKASGDIRITE